VLFLLPHIVVESGIEKAKHAAAQPALLVLVAIRSDHSVGTKPTATKSIALLETLGILEETTGRKRDRTYRYASYLDRLRAGTELIAPGRRRTR
jgi:hypothetical protein